MLRGIPVLMRPPLRRVVPDLVDVLARLQLSVALASRGDGTRAHSILAAAALPGFGSHEELFRLGCGELAELTGSRV
jgi:hypothetical protein